jgi:HAMP domain-containing protein
MRRLEEALRELEALAAEDGASDADHSRPAQPARKRERLQRDLYSLHVICEAMIDLGAVMGLWNSDMVRTACRNVIEFDRIQGESEEIIAERQKELRRLLRDETREIRRSGVRHGHL